jgi:hypothetical protein
LGFPLFSPVSLNLEVAKERQICFNGIFSDFSSVKVASEQTLSVNQSGD